MGGSLGWRKVREPRVNSVVARRPHARYISLMESQLSAGGVHVDRFTRSSFGEAPAVVIQGWRQVAPGFFEPIEVAIGLEWQITTWRIDAAPARA